ncbi:MAG TPA: c-type cytochrome biogenesis protein CcsB [Nakamurella sp.]|nr:c-type cytochrome biogenesis protein CcsB [Nakamurella sp.]
MNETMAQISDLAFEAALAGYVVALVCYAIELASRRGGDVGTAEMAGVVTPAAERGGTSTLTRTGGGGSSADGSGGGNGVRTGAIGLIAPPQAASWGVRFGRAAVVVTVVAVVANLLSVVTRGLAVGRLPLGNMYEFTSVICAAISICWLIVLARTGARTMGAFVMLPVVILAFVAGTVLYVPAAPVAPALNSYWKWIHVTTVALSSSVLMVSGAASVLYLLRGRHERRLATALPSGTGSGIDGDGIDAGGMEAGGFDAGGPVVGPGGTEHARPGRADRSLLGRLPSLATLDRIAYRTAIVAFPVYTFAVIAGALWAEVAWGRYWGWDPKETCAFVTWVIYAAYLHARSTAGWRGRRAAWISVVGFASIMFNLFFVNMVVSGLHSYAGLN